MTTEELTEEEKKRIKDAAEIITNDILWVKTNEGYEYWERVYDALLRLSRKANKKIIEQNGRKYRLVEE